ncbi:hypothetical protein DCAR_0727665 [Daucus carota subsp. sativus]|uniref:PB1-like domain-containing protein n=1 Tax=Daucus carota subsp. sativus TaxID=79200 RepID=A0A164TBI0_DAUCS|nr:hypothetical protein DCAR_0727665 [Daucus carota subsp. sativus]
MRGRLRVDGRVFGENPSWLEVPFEYWSKRLLAGSDAPVIPDPILAPGDETPKYGEDSRFFTIKVHYGRRFDDNMDSYVGGEIRYFDMCEVVDFCLIDMESMLTELGTSNKRQDSKAVEQPPAEAKKPPVQRTAEVKNTTSHGGIFRKFKPPAQSSFYTLLGS